MSAAVVKKAGPDYWMEKSALGLKDGGRLDHAFWPKPVLAFHGERFCISGKFVKDAFKRREAVSSLTNLPEMPVSNHGM